MAKTMFYAAAINTSDATFRIWGKGLSDAMTTVGFTKTADTGQIDWATVLAPTSAGTFMGYEIRAFSDSHQATNPVIVKIEYGTSGSGSTYCGLRITIGRATDGAGNFIGETTNQFIVYSATNTTVYSWYVSGSTDRISAAICADAATTGFGFWLERVKDDTGATTDEGVDFGYVWYSSTTHYPVQIFFPKVGLQFPLATTNNLMPCLLPISAGLSYAGNLGVYPIYTDRGYIANPNLAAFVFDNTVLGSVCSIMTITIFGASHDYVVTRILTGSINARSTNMCLAFRWE